MVDGPDAYDRREWHVESAGDARFPFAHAELYLTWLARRDLLAAERPARDALSPDDLTDEGRAFTDAYYGRYLDDFGAVFAGRPGYSVEPDDDAFDRLAPVIDRRYAEWVYAGRPELPPDRDPLDQLAAMLERADPPPELTQAAVLGMSPEEVTQALRRLLGRDRRPG